MKKYIKKDENIDELMTTLSEKYFIKVEDLEIIKRDLNKLLASKSPLGDRPKAEVHFDKESYYKMKYLVEKCPDEIAWECLVDRDEDDPNVFYIYGTEVPPQIVTGATVDTDDDKYFDYLFSEERPENFVQKRRFHGHSHVNMSTSPSGVDAKYREDCIRNIKDFYIFGIFNKKGDFNFEIFDIENSIIYEDKDIDFYTPEPDYSEWAGEQIKENLVKKTYSTVNNCSAKSNIKDTKGKDSKTDIPAKTDNTYSQYNYNQNSFYYS